MVTKAKAKHQCEGFSYCAVPVRCEETGKHKVNNAYFCLDHKDKALKSPSLVICWTQLYAKAPWA